MNNLYLISRSTSIGYDEYISLVICAPSEAEARQEMLSDDHIHISLRIGDEYSPWPEDHLLSPCLHIGTANDDLDPGIIHASFNAG